MTNQDFQLLSNTTAIPKRNWTPYELNQLLKYGVSLERAQSLGEMPVEYITGKVQFCGLELDVDQNVLIPRVETEELVALVVQKLSSMVQRSKPLVLADIATGSGAIGLAVAAACKRNGWDVTFLLTDVSEKALTVARKNLLQLAASSSIDANSVVCTLSDLLSDLPSDFVIDCVVANLPYIPSAQMLDLAVSVSQFEPHLALDGGEDGLRLVRKLLSQINQLPRLPQAVFLELDSTHTASQLADMTQRFAVTLHADQFGRSRFLQLDSTP